MRKIRLASKDGQNFVVDVEVANVSKTLENKFKSLGDENLKNSNNNNVDKEQIDQGGVEEIVVALPMIRGDILQKVLSWCFCHKDDYSSGEAMEVQESNEETMNPKSPADEVVVQQQQNKGRKRMSDRLKSLKKTESPPRKKAKKNPNAGKKAQTQEDGFGAFVKELETERYICESDLELIKDMDVDRLCELGKAAAYLEIKGLIEVTMKAIQQRLISQYSQRELYDAHVTMDKLFQNDESNGGLKKPEPVCLSWKEEEPSVFVDENNIQKRIFLLDIGQPPIETVVLD